MHIENNESNVALDLQYLVPAWIDSPGSEKKMTCLSKTVVCLRSSHHYTLEVEGIIRVRRKYSHIAQSIAHTRSETCTHEM